MRRIACHEIVSEVPNIFRKALARLGPGTWIALLAAIGILVYGQTNARSPSRPPSRLPSPASALQKPEPALLLEIDNLTKGQVAKIKGVQARWESERASLDKAIRSLYPQSGEPDMRRFDFAAYSDISRRYDLMRSWRWREAVAMLTSSQKKMLPGGAN